MLGVSLPDAENCQRDTYTRDEEVVPSSFCNSVKSGGAIPRDPPQPTHMAGSDDDGLEL